MTSLLPYGGRLSRGAPASSIKLRCVEFALFTYGGDDVKAAGTLVPGSQSYYAAGYSTVWSDPAFASNFALQVSAAKSAAANAVKLSGCGVTDLQGDYGNFGATLNEAFRQLRQAGLRCYFNVFNSPIGIVGTAGDLLAANIGQMQATLRIIELYGAGVVVGLDLVNECTNSQGTVGIGSGSLSGYPASWGAENYAGPSAQAISDLSQIFAAARQATTLPISFSVLAEGPTSYTQNGWLDLQYELCDFHDFHPYYQLGNISSPPIPAAGDMAALEARAKFLGHYIVGENGVGKDGSLASAWYSGLGDIASRPGCFGAVAFPLTSYGGSGADYGMFAPDLVTPRPQFTLPFARWPAGA